jgi:hypothetical protein
MSDDTLDTLIRELEATAERLRAGELEPADAAALVERCAELAARVGTELDARARAAGEPGPGQETLL